MLRSSLMDATRITDGKLVLLKRIGTQSAELSIANQLSSPEYRSDPRNHCVPILDVIPDADDPRMSYIVMPFLRYVDDPDFRSVENIFDCVDQLLEVCYLPFPGAELLTLVSKGLVFLHDHGIAHR